MRGKPSKPFRPLRISQSGMRFSDGTSLSCTFDRGIEFTYLQGPGTMHDRPLHREHWEAVLFRAPASVKFEFPHVGYEKTVQFKGVTTMHQFLSRMFAVSQTKAKVEHMRTMQKATKPSFRAYAHSIGDTYGALLADHKFFEGLQKTGPRQYKMTFGS